MKIQQHKKRLGGYTLMEMLVVIAIIMIIFPTLFFSIERLYETHAVTLSRALILVDATKAVKEMVRDVRSAVYAENGALPIAEMATSSLIIYADTDFDGRVERVHYYLDNDTIQKGVIEPTATYTYPVASETISELFKGVVNQNTNTPIFTYYTSTSSEITSDADVLLVRRISVELMGSATVRGESSEVGFRSSASIRNLKDTY